MPKKEYEAYDLEPFIEISADINCSNCKKSDSCWQNPGEDYFFNEGWRATRDNCYCPECAKKKLKL